MNFLNLVPAAPQNFRATIVMQTQVSLRWDDIPCLDRNADINGYQIRTMQQGDTYVSTNTSLANSFTVNGLLPVTEYSFQVRAIYHDGSQLFGRRTIIDSILTRGKFFNIFIQHSDDHRVLSNCAYIQLLLIVCLEYGHHLAYKNLHYNLIIINVYIIFEPLRFCVQEITNIIFEGYIYKHLYNNSNDD